MKKINTFVVPIIRQDFLMRCLETLYKYTPPNFYVFVIDQTPDGIDQSLYKGMIHMYVRPYRNLGFSKSVNTGIVLSQTPFVTCLNDDTEAINSSWFQGIMDTFAMDEKIIAVNPMSPKEGSWGYGLTALNHDTWQPREGFVAIEDKKSVIPVINGKPFDYKENYTEEEYQSLLNNHPVWQKDSLCDGLACWATIFKREGLEKVGLFDEKFFPGGGEDYSMMIEIYSRGLRAVGTTKSWYHHFWGKSKDELSGKEPNNKLFESRPRWNDLTEIWGDEHDVWGKDKSGKPLKRLVPLFIDDL